MENVQSKQQQKRTPALTSNKTCRLCPFVMLNDYLCSNCQQNAYFTVERKTQSILTILVTSCNAWLFYLLWLVSVSCRLPHIFRQFHRSIDFLHVFRLSSIRLLLKLKNFDQIFYFKKSNERVEMIEPASTKWAIFCNRTGWNM